ncbi:MAG: universal stress protein [Flavobacteriaceae bacterium]|nr:universal stress protein [Flavobacteriaceae bacterium]
MKKILVPVGSMESGLNNIKYAIDFAAISGASVYVINIYKAFSKVAGLTKVNQLMMEDSETMLKGLLDQVETKGVEIIAKPIQGDPYEAISRISKQLDIDLMILSPQSLDKKAELYLGPITGKIVKQTKIPLMIVPKDYKFKKAESILLAFKRGHIPKEDGLKPLKEIAKLFNSKVHLLHVRTPDVMEEDDALDPQLKELQASLTVTENATIFQGVLEHFQAHNPDMLCVLRRKRGFFQKLWEKNSVLKKEFHTSKPLLVLRGQE